MRSTALQMVAKWLVDESRRTFLLWFEMAYSIRLCFSPHESCADLVGNRIVPCSAGKNWKQAGVGVYGTVNRNNMAFFV